MRVSAWNIYGILLLLTWLEGTIAAKKKNHQCPIGFQLAFTDGGLPMCYRQKGPEAFHEKFKDCTGNLYSSKLYHSLNFTKTKQVLWTEYKSLYPGGPFIDWSYTDSTGDILRTTYNVKYDSSLGLDEELCVLIDPVSNFTAARCNERYFRYCFVEPYDEDDRSRKGCADFAGSWRFHSPYSTCLSAVTGVGGGTVRATWRQAQDLCAKRGGSLLNRGWRYSNSPLLHTSGSLPVYPLGIMTNLNHTLLRYDTENDTSEIPFEEWHFQDKYMSPDTTLGAVRNEFWRLVNGSFVFFDVICERPYHIQTVAMNLTVDWENNMLLSVDGDIKKNDINCFTDSMIYYPNKVSISKIEDDVIPHIFRVIPAFDGYYWCVQTFQQRYYPSESNKALFIRSKEAVINLYAVKIHLRKEYHFDNLDKLNRVWKKKLEEFIYYRTKYLAVYGEVPGNDTEEVLKTFKNDRPDLDWKDTEVIYNLKIRRLYLDARTALVHVLLNPEVQPLSPGMWDNLQVIFMKPAYFCNGFESVPTTELGNSVVSTRCRTFTCVGDFNDGVQWVETATANCTTKLPVTKIADIVITTLPEAATDPPEPTTMETLIISQQFVGLYNISKNSADNSTTASNSTESESSDENETTTPCLTVVTTETDWSFPDNLTPTTDNPSTTPPTTTLEPNTLAPEEQLQQVLDDLEKLLVNDTAPTLASIDQPFDLVNDILEEQQEGLEIPGQLLHLLDRIASKVQLVDEKQAITVRDNVAIMMADVTPDNPLRGVRVAARDYDAFSNTSFGFIDSVLEESQLQINESEAVVFLPESVFATPRRISFVAFRNQRAFQSPIQVNSRVFSVNVENLTMFKNGEVIDIHLAPIVGDPDRNQSRVCAFWQFTSNQTGFWSQEGCTLIRSMTPGVLDTCRCTHLTHFAEILVPRTVFSERNENALEILSIIGCVISIFGLVMIGLTAALFRSWRRDYSNKIWLQLCISIFVLIVCFLVIVFANFYTNSVPCMLVGVALHYAVLSSFCWMLVAAVLSYRRLVLVFTRDMSHKLLRASAFAWGAPCAIVGILLSVDPQSYQGQFEEMTPSGAFCYPSGLGLWLAVYTPIAVMLLANWTLFILIVRSVFASRRIQRHGDSNEALRCATVSCLLVFLFGLPWIFGLFASNIVGAYLFTLTATFQGFVLFIFFVLGNKKTRDLWLNKLKIKQTRKIPVTSSTYSNNRSTGPGWRGGVEGATSIEAKTSKPRSLTSPDDSRFS